MKASKFKGARANTNAARGDTVDKPLRSKVIAACTKIANDVILPQIVGQLAPNMAKEVDPAFAKVVGAAAAQWTDAYTKALAQAGWANWYDEHVVLRVRGQGAPGGSALVSGKAGSAEGFAVNAIRTKKDEAPTQNGG